MFSSSNSNGSTPFQPYFPLSSSNYNHHPPPPPPCSGDLFLHHNIHDPLSGQFSLDYNNALIPPTLTHLGVSSSNTIPPSIKGSAALSSCGDDHHQYHNCYGTVNNGNIPYFLHSSREDMVGPAKKDRHSKIFTAQGLRDRRVRLSIKVAREFFDLQDLLGFDRGSKTLEWLLTKSRKAIKQLGAGNKNLTCSTSTGRSKSLSSSSDRDGDDVSDINEAENHVVGKDREMMMMRKLKESESAVHAAAKASRAKARARARARTTEKLKFTTKWPQILNNQLKIFNELDDYHQPNCETTLSSSKVNVADHHMNQELGSLLTNQLAHHQHEEDQSVHVIKRNKVKQFPSVYSNYNQQKYLNVISAERTDQSSNSHIQLPNASQNWDINDAFPFPNIN